MISFKASKAAGFLLASAGILLNANSALATDLVANAQTQASNLLSGSNGRAAAADVSSTISAGQENVDPQDQARRLVLGKPDAARDANRVTGRELNVASARGMRRAAADPQDSARRMLVAFGG